MALLDQVNEKRVEIRTDGYAMSIGEWISLYENKELDIHPEFQRFYRWSDAQKTNLIESILLGIPIPPIFVSQRPDGVWDVVDGLQRLSTIFQFVGILRDDANNLVDPLILSGTKYLPGLDAVRWDEGRGPSIPNELRLILKRSKIHVSIILKESDENAKYDLFQRLNTGGSNLSPQEVRNCILVMIDKSFFEWLLSLSKHSAFQECIALSDRPLSESYDLELALRFVIFSLIAEDELDKLGDVGVFITEKMALIAKSNNFDRAMWAELFKKTFDLLSDSMSDKAFKRWSTSKNRFGGGFLLSQYEVVAYGVAKNLSDGVVPKELEKKIAAIWSNTEYTDWSGSGITATRRLPRLLPLGRKIFSNGN